MTVFALIQKRLNTAMNGLKSLSVLFQSKVHTQDKAPIFLKLMPRYPFKNPLKCKRQVKRVATFLFFIPNEFVFSEIHQDPVLDFYNHTSYRKINKMISLEPLLAV